MDTIKVYVENCIYRNEQNGYCVLDCVEDGEELVAVGTFTGDVQGENLELTGSMIIHPAYGPQFKAVSYRVIRPTDENGILRYLSSGAIKGIGEKTAARIVERFGTDTLDIMENEPERLAEIKGISLAKAQKLGLIVEQKKNERDSLMFLQKYGISVKILESLSFILKASASSVLKYSRYFLSASSRTSTLSSARVLLYTALRPGA